MDILSKVFDTAIGPIIRTVAPTIARSISGPLGGVAAEILLDTLGVPKGASESEIKDRLNQAAVDSDEAKARIAEAEERFKSKAVESMAELGIENTKQVNETIRAEVAAGVSWWHWRHLIGYATLLWAIGPLPILLYYMGKGNIDVVNALIAGLASLTTWFMIIAGLNGYVAADTTNLKTAALTGEQPKSLIARAVNAVKGK